MKFPRLLLSLLLAGAMLTGVMVVSQSQAANYPQPSYTVVKRSNDIEIRTYEPMVIAEVTTLGTRFLASNDGFRILYDYISGNNRSKTKLAMTAPVMQFPLTDRQPSDEWVTQFVLPKGITLKSVPTPTDARIRIVNVPAKTWAVDVFTGNANQSRIDKHSEALLKALKTTAGMPKVVTPFPIVTAFYNAPLTLPMFKHNAVMVEVQKP